MTVVPRPHRFCSDAARARGDDNTATAARVDVWILVELPVTWGREPIADAALPDAVRQALKAASARIARSRVVFIRRRIECPTASRVYVARTTPDPGLAMLDVHSVEELADVPFDELARTTAPAERPLVLVCTHGQRDSCCGRRGYPLYDALRGREDLDVWQCSHIGGDRFAANAVVLPWGVYYGPVEPRDAQSLADSIVERRVVLPSYRGRSALSRPVQAAETFVRRATGLIGLDDLRFVSRESLDTGRLRVRLLASDGIRHDVVIEQYVAAEAGFLTCTASAVNPIPQFRLLEHTASRPPA